MRHFTILVLLMSLSVSIYADRGAKKCQLLLAYSGSHKGAVNENSEKSLYEAVTKKVKAEIHLLENTLLLPDIGIQAIPVHPNINQKQFRLKNIKVFDIKRPENNITFELESYNFVSNKKQSFKHKGFMNTSYIGVEVKNNNPTHTVDLPNPTSSNGIRGFETLLEVINEKIKTLHNGETNKKLTALAGALEKVKSDDLHKVLFELKTLDSKNNSDLMQTLISEVFVNIFGFTTSKIKNKSLSTLQQVVNLDSSIVLTKNLETAGQFHLVLNLTNLSTQIYQSLPIYHPLNLIGRFKLELAKINNNTDSVTHFTAMNDYWRIQLDGKFKVINTKIKVISINRSFANFFPEYITRLIKPIFDMYKNNTLLNSKESFQSLLERMSKSPQMFQFNLNLLNEPLARFDKSPLYAPYLHKSNRIEQQQRLSTSNTENLLNNTIKQRNLLAREYKKLNPEQKANFEYNLALLIFSYNMLRFSQFSTDHPTLEIKVSDNAILQIKLESSSTSVNSPFSNSNKSYDKILQILELDNDGHLRSQLNIHEVHLYNLIQFGFMGGSLLKSKFDGTIEASEITPKKLAELFELD